MRVLFAVSMPYQYTFCLWPSVPFYALNHVVFIRPVKVVPGKQNHGRLFIVRDWFVAGVSGGFMGKKITFKG